MMYPRLSVIFFSIALVFVYSSISKGYVPDDLDFVPMGEAAKQAQQKEMGNQPSFRGWKSQADSLEAPKIIPGQTTKPPDVGFQAEANLKTPSIPMGNVSETEKGQYDSAKQIYDEGKWGAARQGFQKFLKAYPKSQYAESAQFWIAETFYQERWYEKAILEYHKVPKNFPNGIKTPGARFKQGLAFQKIGDKYNAKLVWQELIQKFPKSDEALQAKQKMQ